MNEPQNKARWMKRGWSGVSQRMSESCADQINKLCDAVGDEKASRIILNAVNLALREQENQIRP